MITEYLIPVAPLRPRGGCFYFLIYLPAPAGSNVSSSLIPHHHILTTWLTSCLFRQQKSTSPGSHFSQSHSNSVDFPPPCMSPNSALSSQHSALSTQHCNGLFICYFCYSSLCGGTLSYLFIYFYLQHLTRLWAHSKCSINQ